MKERAAQISLAVALDLLTGDPSDAFHPVRWAGRLIDLFDRLIRGRSRGRAGGSLLVLSVIAVSLGLSHVFLGAARLSRLYRVIAGALLIYYTISFRSLERTASAVMELLEEGQLEVARKKVGEMVGRETGDLDEPGVVRATVESVAENASDGVVAPLFYAALGGPIMAVFYRVVNTLDSMVGYKSERYRDFGRASARLDDALNYIPSRLTAASFLAAGALSGKDADNVIKVLRRDARKHESPNAGRPEAAMAGLLGVQLGGINYYGGRAEERALLGDPVVSLAPERIGEALVFLRLAYGVLLAGLLFILWISKRISR